MLPRDFRIVCGEMTSNLWKFATGDGTEIIAALEQVLGLFETGATQGKSVTYVTGEDVAAFCHQRLRSTTSYLDKWRASLNRDVANKLAQ